MPLKEIQKNTDMLYQNKIDIQSILGAHLEFLNKQRNMISEHISLIRKKLKIQNAQSYQLYDFLDIKIN